MGKAIYPVFGIFVLVIGVLANTNNEPLIHFFDLRSIFALPIIHHRTVPCSVY
jgi:hypothetical protein